MKRLQKGFAAAVVLVLILGLTLVPAPARGGTVYFMAVNDVPLELSASNMPFVSGGVLYVPYIMFTSNYTGVSLGVYAVYNSSKGRAMVYSNRKQLIFDLQENQTYDMDGNVYPEQAMRRDSMVYLPIARVCAVFSDLIRYSRCNTPYGQLVRLKNDSVVLGDEAFVAAADKTMSRSLERYLESLPSPTPSKQPPAQPSAAPSHGVSVPEPSPTPSESPLPTGDGAGVYLGFTLDGDVAEWTAGVEDTLAALANQGCAGVFFLTPEQLERQDDLVRRLLGVGHLVGVKISGGDAETALADWGRAEATLAVAARCRPAAALCLGLDESVLQDLRESGVVCWRSGVDGRELKGSAVNRVSALLGQLARGERAKNFLLLDGTGEGLDGMLSGLVKAEFQLRTPVPTEL